MVEIPPYRGRVRDNDPMPFKVEMWTADNLHVEQELARSVSQTMAKAAFLQAQTDFPNSNLTLRRRLTLIESYPVPRGPWVKQG